MIRIFALAAALLAVGCFDSLVSGECRSGYVADGVHCVGVLGPDGGDADGPIALDAMIDADDEPGRDGRDASDDAPVDAVGTGDDAMVDGGGGGGADASVDAGPFDPDANVDGGGGGGADAGVDAGPLDPDANVDGGGGGGADAGVDAGPLDPDANVDGGGGGGADAGVDAGPLDPDASVDGGGGGGADAGVDAGPLDPDASVDGGGGGGADAGVDAGPLDPDASPLPDATPPVDALVCDPPLEACFGECVNTQTDPDNCGSCGTVCGTGLCELGVCVGETVGHVVLIGHDYSTWRSATARLLANAVGLGPGSPLRVVFYRGNAPTGFIRTTSDAITAGLASSSRPWEMTLAETQDELRDLLRVNSTLVVLSQDGSAAEAEAVGAALQAELSQFLARGGSVVVLEGTRGASHRFLVGANLMAVAAPMNITDQTVNVIAPSDSVATSVPTPYRALSNSVSFTIATGTYVVVDMIGRPVVIHRTVN